MLDMQGIAKIFRTDLIETHALRNFNVRVEAGEFVAVTGPSGSGKTTFLNTGGLLEPFEHGTYKLDGEDVSRIGDDQRSRMRNEKIGFIFQSFNLIPDLNVYDNVDVPLRYRRLSAADRHTRITSALDIVGLASRMKHIPAQLSGAIALGIAVCTITLTLYHGMSNNPIWWKGDKLYSVTIDSWDLKRPDDEKHPERPPPQLTYKDTMALLKSDIPRYKVAMFRSDRVLDAGVRDVKPKRTRVRVTTG